MRTRKELSVAYKLRWKRRRLLFRAVRKRRQLSCVVNRVGTLAASDILVFATIRNEMPRLPHFLEHYRALGVEHFFFVDNGSTDGSRAFLCEQPDVSLWHTDASYKLSRFGVDWLTYLLAKYGHGHWCLTLDADELLVYPFHDTRPLTALTRWLDDEGIEAYPAMMLDMYPKGPLGSQQFVAGESPLEHLNWFDAGNYMIQRQEPLQNLWIQGGPRARVFFRNEPRRAPTLNKVPLVKWHRRYVYVNSTHSLLPRRLNHVYGTYDEEKPSGILLHTKFLPEIVEKSAEEKARKEHFNNSSLYDAYYDSLMTGPDLWCVHSTKFIGWRQLEALGLMSKGAWY